MTKRWPALDRQLSVYYKLLKSIPKDPLSEIVRDFLLSSRQVPTPQDFIDQWHNWQRANKQKMVEDVEKELCGICDSSGILDVVYEKEMQYKQLLACGHCENWRRLWSEKKKMNGKWRRLKTWTLDMIEDKGWELAPRSGIKSKVIESRKDIFPDEGFLKKVPGSESTS